MGLKRVFKGSFKGSEIGTLTPECQKVKCRNKFYVSEPEVCQTPHCAPRVKGLRQDLVIKCFMKR